jgi:hypothetical protein
MVLGGGKGHLAVMEWSKAHLVTELQVKETVRDVCFLHNDKFFAAAQRKYVYIYDKRGLEIHCLREHTQVITGRITTAQLAALARRGCVACLCWFTAAHPVKRKCGCGACRELQRDALVQLRIPAHGNARGSRQVHAMQFLPLHFLLATIGKPGVLVYQVRASPLACT